MSLVEVMFGTCERDLFDAPGHGHRTYFDPQTGSHFTGVDSLDACYTLMPHVPVMLRSQGYRLVSSKLYDERAGEVEVWIQEVRPDAWIDAVVYPVCEDDIPPEHYPIYDGHTEYLLLEAPEELDDEDGWDDADSWSPEMADAVADDMLAFLRETRNRPR